MTLEQLIALLDVAEGSSARAAENVFEQLAADELVDRDGNAAWKVTARGQAFVDHVRALPLPQQTVAWRMPGAAVTFEPGAIRWTGVEEGPPPPPPPLRPKRVIPTDPELLKLEAIRMMDAGFGMNEVKEQLELTAAQAQQFFFGH